jgi:pyruvate-ferredoxin/flavodoxin oxidoreductase
MLQSKAGIINKDYAAQRSILAEVDAGKIPKEELFARGEQLLRDRLQPAGVTKPAKGKPGPVLV